MTISAPVLERSREAALDWLGSAPLAAPDALIGRPLRVLMVSTLFKLPYRVLRCAHAAGAEVYCLGARQSRGLAASRYCRRFIASKSSIEGNFNQGLLDEINHYVKELDIDLVAPGDIRASRSLIVIKDRIGLNCFPLPELEAFDRLNDKRQFGDLCATLNISHPAGAVYASRSELAQALRQNGAVFPKIAKPLAMEAGIGCVRIDARNLEGQLSKIFYEPILLQDYIVGAASGASIFCRNGEIVAFVAHRCRFNVYTTFHDESIYADLAKLAGALKLDGVFNFDMRQAVDGAIHYLECNPRFYFKMAMSMIAGLNFVSLGFPGRDGAVPPKICPSATVRFPKALVMTLATPWKLNANAWRALRFTMADPIPYLREELGFEAGR